MKLTLPTLKTAAWFTITLLTVVAAIVLFCYGLYIADSGSSLWKEPLLYSALCASVAFYAIAKIEKEVVEFMDGIY